MMRHSPACIGFLAVLVGCTTTTPEQAADLTVALDLAATVEGAYAARPTADPMAVAELKRLLDSAQAAVAAWQASGSTSDRAIANAAIAALVEYEATAGGTP